MAISNDTYDNLMRRIKEDHRGWDGEAGTQLYWLLRDELAATARRQGRDLSEAVSVAWEILTLDTENLLGADNVSALLKVKVARRLIDEATAERLLNSPAGGGKARAAQAQALSPQRLDERFEDEYGYVSAVEQVDVQHELFALQLAAKLIAESSNLSLDAARLVVETMCETAALGGVGSTITARRRAIGAASIGLLLGVDAKTWSAAATLVLGSKSGAGSLIRSELDGELKGEWTPSADARVRAARKRMGLAA
jgi:hypothetical protein